MSCSTGGGGGDLYKDHRDPTTQPSAIPARNARINIAKPFQNQTALLQSQAGNCSDFFFWPRHSDIHSRTGLQRPRNSTPTALGGWPQVLKATKRPKKLNAPMSRSANIMIGRKSKATSPPHPPPPPPKKKQQQHKQQKKAKKSKHNLYNS